MILWRKSFVILIFVGLCDSGKFSAQCPNLKTDLRTIRKKRALAFPDGSAFVITIDTAKTFMTHVPSGWYVTMDLDLVFSLPDEKTRAEHSRRKLHHRQKREIWDTIVEALYMHNLDGNSCLLRSICEAKMYLAPPGRSLVHDLLRVIFTAPIHDEDFRGETGGAYEDLYDPDICDKRHNCPISILQLLLMFNK